VSLQKLSRNNDLLGAQNDSKRGRRAPARAALKLKIDRRLAAWSIQRAEFDERPILAVVDQCARNQHRNTVEINFEGISALLVSFQEGDVIQARTLFEGRQVDQRALAGGTRVGGAWWALRLPGWISGHFPGDFQQRRFRKRSDDTA